MSLPPKLKSLSFPITPAAPPFVAVQLAILRNVLNITVMTIITAEAAASVGEHVSLATGAAAVGMEIIVIVRVIRHYLHEFLHIMRNAFYLPIGRKLHLYSHVSNAITLSQS